MSVRRSAKLLLPLTILFALVLAACGGDDPTPTPTRVPLAATPTSAPTPTSPPSGSTPTAPTPRPLPTATPTPEPSVLEMAEAHFSGKSITVLVGYGAGGGQDNNARLVSKHLGKHMPGNPRFIVQNITGADGLIAGQRAQSRPPDGTTVVLVNNVLTEQTALGGKSLPGFDLNEASYLGNIQISTPGSGAMVCVRSDIATTFEGAIAAAEALGRPLRAGVFRAGSWGVTLPKFLNMPFQPVPGYTGTATILQAIDQKELEVLIDACTLDQLRRQRPDWIAAGDVITPILNRNGEDLTPAQSMFTEAGWDFPPLIEDVWPLDDFQKQVLDASRAMGSVVTHPWVLAKGTPDWIVQVWKTALEDVTKDEGFIADMARVSRVAGYTPAEAYTGYRDELAGFEGPLLGFIREFAGLTN